ncbi:serine protease [Streptomyces collinus]|uniref:S1 family peptidase n=1 Tax=Streptomyces collinus TaxID=42684 RepID=UPI00365F59DD
MTKRHPVPAYLGRVLSPSGVPQGTCFQIAPGWLVTAWHVAQATLALGDDEVLRVDRLSEPGAERIGARVVAEDRKADLILLRADKAFPASARLLRGSRSVRHAEPVTVLGHALVQETGDQPPVLWVEALGEWQGEARRTDDVTLGRFYSRDVLPGMSGSPVRQRSDDSVVGVVSARYNTSDGWLVHSVWSGRVEDLRELCKGHVGLDESRWVGFAGATTVAVESLGAGHREPDSGARTETAWAPDPQPDGPDPDAPLPNTPLPNAPVPNTSAPVAGPTDPPAPAGSGDTLSDTITEEVSLGLLARFTRWISDTL